MFLFVRSRLKGSIHQNIFLFARFKRWTPINIILAVRFRGLTERGKKKRGEFDENHHKICLKTKRHNERSNQAIVTDTAHTEILIGGRGGGD